MAEEVEGNMADGSVKGTPTAERNGKLSSREDRSLEKMVRS